MQIKIAVKRCYFAVDPRIVYTTRQLLPAAQKDDYLLHIKVTLFINFCATVIRRSVRGSYFPKVATED